VKAGVTASIPITITPTANGFANQVAFSVTGLPAHASLVPFSVTPGATKSTVNLMIMTTARSAAPPASPMDEPLTPMLRMLLVSWIAALLAGLYAARLIRRTPRLRRYAAMVPLTLLLVSGAVLAGCASAMKGTPPGTSQLTITATSGTFSQSTPNPVMLTVQ
jgi:apolipoprotein N-acyltransferase